MPSKPAAKPPVEEAAPPETNPLTDGAVSVSTQELPPEPAPEPGSPAPEGGVVTPEAQPVADPSEVPALDSLTPGIRVRNF